MESCPLGRSIKELCFINVVPNEMNKQNMLYFWPLLLKYATHNVTLVSKYILNKKLELLQWSWGIIIELLYILYDNTLIIWVRLTFDNIYVNLFPLGNGV